eukprot:SAG11_NODE_815_length_7030_cov_23.197807_1_plen_1905_part_10
MDVCIELTAVSMSGAPRTSARQNLGTPGRVSSDAEEAFAKAWALFRPTSGGATDWEAAAKGFGVAAKAGHPEAQFYYARCHNHGWGVPADRTEGEKWMTLAAESGHSIAQAYCGFESSPSPSKAALTGSSAQPESPDRKVSTPMTPVASPRSSSARLDTAAPENVRRQLLPSHGSPNPSCDHPAGSPVAGPQDAVDDAVRTVDDLVTSNSQPLRSEAAEEAFSKAWALFRPTSGSATDWEAAAKGFGVAAKAGHPEAQFYYARCHNHGWGVPADRTEGEKWMTLAAESGHSIAQAYCGLDGSPKPPTDIKGERSKSRPEQRDRTEDVSPKTDAPEVQDKDGNDSVDDNSPSKAFELFGAAQVTTEAAENFRKAWEASRPSKGGATNWEAAAEGFGVAARQGHPEAQFYYARCFKHGWGVPENHDEGEKWMRLAADAGHAIAQTYCGTHGGKKSISKIDLMKKAILHMENLKLANSFQLWARATEALMNASKQNAVEIFRSDLNDLRRALAALRNRQLGRGFRGWRRYIEELARMRLALLHMRHTLLSRCWFIWQEKIAIWKEESERERITKEHQEEVVALEALLHARQERVATAMLQRWKLHFISNYWHLWNRLLELRKIEGKALVRLLNARMSATFDMWAAAVSEAAVVRKIERERQQHEEELQALQAMLAAQKGSAVEAVLQHWMKQRVSKCFASWVYMVGRKKVLLKALLRLTHHRLTRSFEVWRWGTLRAMELKTVLNRVMRRCVHIKTAGAFEYWQHAMWLEHARKLSEERAAHQEELVALKAMLHAQKDHTAEAVLQRWIKRSVSKCFASWVVLLQWKKLLLKGLARLKNRRVATAFEGWHSAAQQTLSSQKIAGRAVARMQRVLLAVTMGLWSEHVKLASRMRTVSHHLMIRWRMRCVTKAFQKWHTFVRAEVSLQQKLARVVRRLQHGKLTSALTCWSALVMCKNRNREIQTRIIMRAQRVKLAGAFDAWCTFMEKQVHIRTVIDRMLHKRLARCWSSWVHATSVSQGEREREAHEAELMSLKLLLSSQKERAAGAVMQHWTRQSVSKCFLAWVYTMHQIDLLRKGLLRLTYRKLKNAFEGWRTVITRTMSHVAISKRVVAKMQRVLLAVTMGLWSEHVKLASRMRTVSHHLMIRWRMRCVTKAFQKWHTFVRAEVSLQQKLARVVRRLQHGKLTSALTCWSALVMCKNRNREIQTRIIMRAQRVKLAGAFDAWCTFMEKQVHIRTVIDRMLHKRLARCWSSWVHATSVSQGEREREAHEAELMSLKLLLSSQKERAAGAVMQHWTRQSVSKCLLLWRENVFAFINLERRSRRAALRWRVQSAAKAFAYWNATTRRKKVEQRKLLKMLHKIRQRRLDMALESWRLSVSRSLSLTAVSSHAVLRLQYLKIAGAFDGWCTFMDWQVRTRHVLGRMLYKSLARCWLNWIEAITIIEEERERDEHQEELLALRMTLTAQKERAAKVVMHHWGEKIVSKCWASWVYALGQNKLLIKGLMRLQHRRTASTFAGWRWSVSQTQEDREQAEQEKELMSLKLMLSSQKERAAKAVMQNWKKQCVSKCFITWVHLLHQINLLKKGLLRLQHRAVVTAFDDWSQQVSRSRRTKAVISRAVTRMIYLVTAATLGIWRENVQACLRVRQVQRRAVVYLFKQSLSKSFQTWRIWMAEKTDLKHKMVKVLRRLQHTQLATVLDLWWEHVAALKEQQATLRRVLMRMTHAKMAGAFDAWCSFTETQLRLKKTLGRIKHMGLARCWSSWLDTMDVWEREREEAAHREELIRLKMTLSSQKEQTAETVLLRWKRQSVSKCFATWRQCTAEKTDLKHKMVKVLRRLQHMQLATVLDLWWEHVAALKEQQATLRRVLMRMTHARLAGAFDAWCSFTETQLRLKKTLGRIKHMGLARC